MKTLLSFTLLCFIVGASSAKAELQTQVSVYSDYYFRGVGFEKNTPSINWLAEYQTSSGIYAGIWLAQQNTENNVYYKREVDYWLGFSQAMNENWLFDFSYNRYNFPGSWIRDYDWEEVQFNIHYQQQWSLGFGVNRNQFSFDQRGTFVELTHRRALAWEFIADASVGVVNTDALFEIYHYYQMGLSKPVGAVHIRLAWANAEGGQPELYRRARADNAWLLGVSYAL